MKLYLLEQNFVIGYDTYDSVVVCAENEEKAKLISPYKMEEVTSPNASWVGRDNIDKIKVTYLGEASSKLKKGVIIASYKAG